MTDSEEKQLIAEAVAGREYAEARFSNFRVGAALRTRDGRIIRGCNVENCTLGLTVCAERVALLSAIAAGERHFDAVAVVTSTDEPSTPCGPCRQLLWEFCGDIEVILANLDGATRHFRLSELLPHPFDLRPETPCAD